jgi:hypothetical protein
MSYQAGPRTAHPVGNWQLQWMPGTEEPPGHKEGSTRYGQTTISGSLVFVEENLVRFIPKSYSF